LAAALKAYRDPYDLLPGLPSLPGPLLGANASRHAISSTLQNGAEFLHLAGHIIHDKKDPNQSAIICANNDPLTVDAIRSFPGAYAFVFLNGCNGGRAAYVSGPQPDSPTTTGNPLDDIAYASDIESVMKNGVIYAASALVEAKKTEPR